MKKVRRAQFIEYLKGALAHLYDSEYLRQTPLVAIFGITDRFDASMILRNILSEAIEAIKPLASDPHPDRAWRIYDSLYYCYVQRLSQQAVADQLGLSVRHLRREQRAALSVLAETLCQEHGLHTLFIDDPPCGDDFEYDPLQELEWLRGDSSEAPLVLSTHLSDILGLTRQLAAEYQVTVQTHLESNLPPLAVHPVAFDQIMLSLLSNAITACPNKPVVVKVAVQAEYVVIDIAGEKTTQQRAAPRNLEFQNERRYEVARQLTALSKGTIQIDEAHELFSARLALPYVQQAPVLVVDDNPDMLQIIQRYAQDSRYRIVATQSATQAMELAKQIPPVAIILDVMIPQIDGWKLLGRFREHPATSKVPVIICTVLPQEELAISLGAVAFLKKPFSRQDFLAALDPWVEPGE